MTSSPSSRSQRLTRRMVLRRMGLAASAVYAAPLLTGVTQAHASDGSAGSAGSGSGSGVVSRPAPPRPEIVVATPDAGGIDLIASQGYALVERTSIGIVTLELGRFTLPPNRSVAQAEAEISGLVPGAIFDLNHLYEPGELACVDGDCQAFQLIGWTDDARACPAGVTIGMIDTTVNAEHAALSGVELSKVQVLAADRTAGSAIHGTAIAILLAGGADTRTPGLLSGVKLVAAEAFHKATDGEDRADIFDIARAIDRLVQQDVSVINMSFAGPANAILERVAAAAIERDVILVAAAGNAGPQSEPLYPAAYEGVVAVTAVDGERQVYRRAVNGAHIDFAGPGVQLWTAASVSGGRFRSGTSYAAPFVSAALAVARAQEPDTPADQLVSTLAAQAADLGDPGRDDVFGWGLVQTEGICR
jgi:hypothetical protein